MSVRDLTATEAAEIQERLQDIAQSFHKEAERWKTAFSSQAQRIHNHHKLDAKVPAWHQCMQAPCIAAREIALDAEQITPYPGTNPRVGQAPGVVPSPSAPGGRSDDEKGTALREAMNLVRTIRDEAKRALDAGDAEGFVRRLTDLPDPEGSNAV